MDFEDKYEIADLRRRLSNLLRIGTISAVNYKEAVARVKIGDLETTWLPWLLRDGDDKAWHGVDLNEQVLVLSPCGDLNQGLILPSVYKKPIFNDGKLPAVQTAVSRGFRKVRRFLKLQTAFRHSPLRR